jgi:uncharacterized protein
MNLEKMSQIAADLLKDKRSHPYKELGNKYYHGVRPAKLALTLRKIIFPDDSSHDEILTAAAWFHDCANGNAEHCEEGARLCGEILKGLCTDSELEEICQIIRVHDDRSMQNDYSPWTKIHQDADHLDHFGSYDVMMGFFTGNAALWTIDRMADWFINYRDERRDALKGELNYDISRRILDEKIDFSVSFGRRFKAEIDGDIIGLEDMNLNNE